ncbi:MAG: hypothetical protein XD91_0158 [Clostridiales bacterium 38_11]|nr:MAG: hypothetical protein XD91_0158 [Clostridiales bacterium 38_11]HBH12924.1 DsrE family protein [Clostridiales bacterium]
MNKLVILWTDRDKVSAENMIFMYGLNSKLKGWWDEVTLIIWGASTELTANDETIQKSVKKMIDNGVHIKACKACAENLNAVEKLESIGVEVFYIGQTLTEYLKDKDVTVLTF